MKLEFWGGPKDGEVLDIGYRDTHPEIYKFPNTSYNIQGILIGECSEEAAEIGVARTINYRYAHRHSSSGNCVYKFEGVF